MSGVAMVTSEGNWLARSRLLSKHGFEAVDRVEPSFALMVHRLKGTRTPRFTGRWSEKARGYGKGLTVIRSDQCPYNEDAVENLLAAAGEQGVPSRVVELNSARDIRARSPSPYGTFGVVLDGRLVSYHYLLRKDADSLLRSGRWPEQRETVFRCRGFGPGSFQRERPHAARVFTTMLSTLP